MSSIASTPKDAETKNAPTSGRLFFLDLSGGRILSANPDGSDLKTIINEGRRLPDGLVLDVAAWEQPQLFSEEMRAGFRSLRSSGATRRARSNQIHHRNSNV